MCQWAVYKQQGMLWLMHCQVAMHQGTAVTLYNEQYAQQMNADSRPKTHQVARPATSLTRCKRGGFAALAALLLAMYQATQC